MLERLSIIHGMNKLNKDKRIQVIAALVEGNSVRATCRMTGVAKGTVLRLLAEVGQACADYQDRAIRNVKSRRIQCDEIWSFCYAKSKNVPEDMRGKFGVGDIWTWVAIDAETKLAISWLVGGRSAGYAKAFIADLATRLANRVQLTTDGYKIYLDAVEGAFGCDVDYATLVKLYGDDRQAETRYSPAQCIGAQAAVITGKPDPRHISTSFVERQNLTMRMGMRRFTRLTNAFSKKVENLRHAVALHFAFYNLCRIHQTLRVTPAMEAGLTDHVWDIGEIAGLTA
jgi:IS1 family transposase